MSAGGNKGPIASFIDILIPNVLTLSILLSLISDTTAAVLSNMIE